VLSKPQVAIPDINEFPFVCFEKCRRKAVSVKVEKRGGKARGHREKRSRKAAKREASGGKDAVS
jgi:hypothetical protein